MKQLLTLPAVGVAAMTLVSCGTTDQAGNGGTYQDPYYGSANGQQGYGQTQGGSGQYSDYVQVSPTGQQGGGGAYQGYQNYGGQTGGQSSGQYQQPSYQQPAYQQPSYSSGGGGSSYSGGGSSYSGGGSSYSGGGSSYSGGGGRSYTVQGGDTLYRISKNNGTSVEAIMSANGLTSTLIRPGDVLTIP